jgi:hypothetical protein
MHNQATAQHYRDHAEELRRIAERLDEGNFKRMILGIAQDYEELASGLTQTTARSVSANTAEH